MSKPEDAQETFPPYVLIAARRAALTQYNSDMKSYSAILNGEADTWPIVKVAARAIQAAVAAQREACAALVDEHRRLLNGQYEVLDIGREDAIYSIVATAIRERGQHE